MNLHTATVVMFVIAGIVWGFLILVFIGAKLYSLFSGRVHGITTTNDTLVGGSKQVTKQEGKNLEEGQPANKAVTREDGSTNSFI